MATIGVLGPVELTDADGTPVALSPRVRSLLAALAVRAGAVGPVDWLAEVVWGADQPEHVGNAVQTLVSRLRSALRAAGGGPQVLTRPDGYELVTDADGLDAVAFRGLVARARRARRPEDRIVALTAAVGLWRGPAYGRLGEEDFAGPEAAALEELRATAVGDLAETELGAGQPGAAQERLTPLVAGRPYDERPVLLLMRCLASTGRTGEALAVYADLRRRLRDDLGLDPSAEAAAAQRALLTPERSGSVVGLRMPGDVLGRGDDERALAALLEGGGLVTVLGPGGVGKTTLALRVARNSAGAFRDGVVGVELDRLASGDDPAQAVATVLQLPTGADSPTRQLVELLRSREQLLVLDSCEHLLTGVGELVDRLLAACPGLTVLATSRVSLRIAEERVLRLDPLPDDAAVELFRRRAAQRVHAYRPTAAELDAVAGLCRRLDGLPLAIELAASRVDVITPEELLDRWSWHRSVLRGTRGDGRHRSLTALVDWSYERLPRHAQHTFDTVSVFAGDFGLGDVVDLVERLGPEAEAADGQVGDGQVGDGQAGEDVIDLGWSLTTLVDSSMITRSPATGRLRLLETLRTYGRSRLADRGNLDRVAAAHATLFADRAEAGRNQLYGPGDPREVRRLLASVDELRAAYGWSLSQHPVLAQRIVGAAVLLVEHTMLGEVVGWADTVLAGGGVDDPWVWSVAAAGARFVGDLDRAAALADRALELAGTDAVAASYALLVRSDVALFAGDRATILASAARAAEPARAMVAFNALLIRHYAGESVDPAEARTLRVEADRHGRSVVAAWARYVEGELLLDTDPAQAYDVLVSAREQARGLGDEYLIGVCLVSAASAVHRAGRLDEACRLFIEVIRHWRLRGDRTHQWTTLRNVVEVLDAVDRRAEALTIGAALLVAERGAAGFGEDAVRLGATVARLTADQEGAVDRVNRGLELRDEQVIEEALAALGGVVTAADRTGRTRSR